VCVRWQRFEQKSVGRLLPSSTSGRLLFDSDGRFLGYRGVTTEVTAVIRAEQVEKALHPLAAIGADANACLRWLAADKPDLDSVREALTAIVKDGDRAGAVIGARRMVVRATLDQRDDGPRGDRRRRGCRGRLRAGRGGPPVRGVLHEEAGWAGYGAIDQPLDH